MATMPEGLGTEEGSHRPWRHFPFLRGRDIVARAPVLRRRRRMGPTGRAETTCTVGRNTKEGPCSQTQLQGASGGPTPGWTLGWTALQG